LWTLPLYLLARPLLRLLGMLRPGRSETWVVGGHSGRLYADNAGALHQRLQAAGHDVLWVSGDAALSATLRARGVRVLRRNSFRARLAIENAAVLAYSHGFSDLDHCLWHAITPGGLKIHLNHCLNHLKAGQLLRPKLAGRSDEDLRKLAAKLDPFDYLLASSTRERDNFLRSYPGGEERIVLGGGAHLDAFMRARAEAPSRTIVYFPTFRETPTAEEALSQQVAALCAHEQLLGWLERNDYTLQIVRHINAPTAPEVNAIPGAARVELIEPGSAAEALLKAAVLISDYSGVLCDFLALDRPTIFFAFDLDDYLRHRNLYVDYAEFAFGPRVDSVEALVQGIVSSAFLDQRAFAAKRSFWQREFFPELAPVYTDSTVATIRALLARRGSRL
jgi:hypothetical protein